MNYAKLYHEAEMVSLLTHRNQTYDIFPYEKHLRDVVDVLKRDGHSGDALIAGWLHDSIEDGDLTYSKIKQAFGTRVAEIVFAVTDELGRNRKERKAKTYPKIRACGELAIIVKLADRIANIEHGQRMGNDIVKMYYSEYQDFRDNLFTPEHLEASSMWKHLDKILTHQNKTQEAHV